MEFFQTEQCSPCAKAFRALKKSAGACTASGRHPRPLSIRTVSAGNFDVVNKESIDIDQRDWCKKSTFRKKTEKGR